MFQICPDNFQAGEYVPPAPPYAYEYKTVTARVLDIDASQAINK